MAITYRSGSTAGNGSGGNLTINKPAGVVDGDILIATCYNEISTTAWTPPAGWAQWGSGQANTSMYINTYWKRASGEGASYTFNISTTWRVISMGAFSGALASGDPINVGPTGNTGTGGTIVALSITTTEANTMAVALHGNIDGGNVSVGTSGYTQGPFLGGCELWYHATPSTGATGNKSFEYAGASYAASYHLAIREGTGSSPSASPSASPSGSPSPSPSGSPSASPSRSPSSSPSASPSNSPSTSPSGSPSGSPSASPSATPSMLVGDVVWGHDTGVQETDVRNFVGQWTGTGFIENPTVADIERIRLYVGEYMISQAVQTGAVYVTLEYNKYVPGDIVTLEYRHGTTIGNCYLDTWHTYNGGFNSLGFVQIRVSK